MLIRGAGSMVAMRVLAAATTLPCPAFGFWISHWRGATRMERLPRNATWLLRRAVRAAASGHHRTAAWLCWLRLRGSANPEDYFTLCCYPQSLYLLGRHNDHKAADLYKRAIRLNPQHALAHAGLGTIHHSNASRIAQEVWGFPGEPQLTLLDGISPEDLYADGESTQALIPGVADEECANAKIATYELERAAKLCKGKDEKAQLLLMAAQVHAVLDKERGRVAVQAVLVTVHGFPEGLMLLPCGSGYSAATWLMRRHPNVRTAGA